VTRSPYARGPVTVELNGVRIPVPHHCAADWIQAVSASSGPSAVLVQLVRANTHEFIMDDMAIGGTTGEELAAASYDLIKQTVPAFDWWATYRLLVLSATDRMIVGRTVLAGFDPWSLSAAQWCSGVYAMILENADKKDEFKFEAALFEVPEGVEQDSEWADMTFDQMVASARSTPGIR
jgi:hypothetical protein